MWTASVSKTVETVDEEILYMYSASAETKELAEKLVCIYASMVEYGMVSEKWKPGEMMFPEEQLYQFITPQTLEQLKAMYGDVVPVAYMNAMAYINSYFGNMFNIEDMMLNDDTSLETMTLRLCLCLKTVSYILSSSPQWSETVEQNEKQLHFMLRGLKSGQRNMGKNAIIADPDVRVASVTLSKKGNRP